MSYAIQLHGQIMPTRYGSLEDALDSARLLVEEEAEFEVLQIEVVRDYPRILTEEQRKKFTTMPTLRDYADSHICGDGLEIDMAEHELKLMTDADLIRTIYLAPLEDDAESENAVVDLVRVGIAEERAREIVAELRK